MAIEPRALRSCLGQFATGVTVVSCTGPDGPHGATVNAFTAVSLDPPLVLVSLDRRSRACRHLVDAAFTVNLLAEPQDDVALHFAGRPMPRRPGWEPGVDGLAPRLRDSLAWIACAPWRHYDGGDHVLYLGEVCAFGQREAAPLVFHRGSFRHLGPAFETVPWLGSADSPGLSWFSPSTQRSTA